MTYELFKKGDSVKIVPAGSAVVTEYLGAGSQAEVYRVSLNGKDYALKWYYPGMATALQRAALERLIERRSPSREFLWPIAMAAVDGRADYGYIMPVRPASFSGLYELVTRRVDPTFRTVLTAGMNLANAYLNLHVQGLCYRDISINNAFFSAASGDILVCDNDNVTVDGEFLDTVLGTQRFMAPEIVRGEAPPSTQADLFSLSVLLFYLLLVAHPLDGRREVDIHAFDLNAMRHLYGEVPTFIFDPMDDSNRPVPGVHDNALIYWPIYPEAVRRKFIAAFTEGLRDPGRRVRETEWRAVLSNARDALLYCNHCRSENFYGSDPERVELHCWNCKEDIRLPFRMRLAVDVTMPNPDVVMLNTDTRLFDHHLGFNRSYDFSAALAEVTVNPNSRNLLGLKNLSDRAWSATTLAGDLLRIEPGRSVELRSGLKINFGGRTGEVRD